MQFNHGTPLHIQVAGHARRLIAETAPDTCLPPDARLASTWNVSVRTVREALILLEAEGLVERRRGSGTWVREPRQRPVALFSELSLLHPKTPRFFGVVLDVVRERLAEAGVESRLYTGHSKAGDVPGFSCEELVADAQAGLLGGILSLTSNLKDPRLAALRDGGMPMVRTTGDSPLGRHFTIDRIPSVAVPYLLQSGRRKVAMIGWDRPSDGASPTLIGAFRAALQEHGAGFREEWCRVEHSFAWSGSAWEEFREIWFAGTEKPDALLVTDENFLPEIYMAALQLHLEIPKDLLIVSHQARSVTWSLPAPVARVEQDAFAFAEHLALEMLAALRGEPAPVLSDDLVPYRLFPIHETARHVEPQPTQPRMSTP